MCTVTYIPAASGAFLTSNRDERISRAPAGPPVTRYAGGALTYPKDAHAGGTWIVLKGQREAAVLLNGAFENHTRKQSYRKSRGIVMLDIMKAPAPTACFEKISLEGIEPFTLILFTGGKLTRCTWDGSRKHRQELNAREPHIWASATLYGSEARQVRELRLQQWACKTDINAESILDFHLSKDIIFSSGQSSHPNRAEMATVSVTSIDLTSRQPVVHYHDLPAQKSFAVRPHSGAAHPIPAFNSISWKFKRFLIRARSWEYWPLACVYLPMVPRWLWLSIKAGAFWFFGAANPSMRYAGFAGERKSRIYRLMPKGSYPQTLLCEAGSSQDKVASLLDHASLTFPMIAKPDIGERGVQVKLLASPEDLEDYRRQSQVDFLLQPYIDYPREAGIFYYRMPGARRGQISGIVGKELLSVTGDGRSDILTLLLKDDRAVLQLPSLQRTLVEKMRDIPAAGEKLNLVPYGNHSRGSKFVDMSNRITPALTEVIDRLCGAIPGFDFGRLDIRFKSWEDLEAGRHFSVIELNGAASEPTHIYDPRHSIYFAWKEIYRHWKILCQISMANARNGVPGMTFRQGIEMVREHGQHLSRVRRFLA